MGLSLLIPIPSLILISLCQDARPSTPMRAWSLGCGWALILHCWRSTLPRPRLLSGPSDIIEVRPG